MKTFLSVDFLIPVDLDIIKAGVYIYLFYHLW